MTLCAFILLDTGAIIFQRSAVRPPRAQLLAVGDSRTLPPRIFAAAEIDGPRVSVPGYAQADPAERDVIALQFITTLAQGQETPFINHPPAGTAAARSPSEPFNNPSVCTAAQAAAGREDRA